MFLEKNAGLNNFSVRMNRCRNVSETKQRQIDFNGFWSDESVGLHFPPQGSAADTEHPGSLIAATLGFFNDILYRDLLVLPKVLTG